MSEHLLLPICITARSRGAWCAGLALFYLAAFNMAQAATFVVTSTADTNGASCASTCSLREAINAANNNPGADNIHFNVSSGSGARVFAPASKYPALVGPTVIDGYTQPGASANTQAVRRKNWTSRAPGQFGRTLEGKFLYSERVSSPPRHRVMD